MSDNVLSVGSLFAGIGGIELGLEMTGRFKTIWQVEQNEYCRKVLARHWPDATRFEDVRNVGKENLAPVDVLCGGFPCQDVSYAGKGEGLSGARSGLWYEYARIVSELRPSFVVVENVRALLVRGVDRVLGSLAEIGYDAEWQVLSAQEVGAPHLRERLFIIAYPNADSGGFSRLQEPDIGTATELTAPRRHHAVRLRATVADTDSSSRREQRRPFSIQSKLTAPERAGWWSVEPAVGRVAHGVPRRVDRLRALGNAVVPQCARVIGERLLEIHDSLTQEGATV